MIKNFKFFRGDEYEISQLEWNRRRDALIERYARENEERRRNDESFERLIRFNQQREAEAAAKRVLELLNQKPKIWDKIKYNIKVSLSEITTTGYIIIASIFIIGGISMIGRLLHLW